MAFVPLGVASSPQHNVLRLTCVVSGARISRPRKCVEDSRYTPPCFPCFVRAVSHRRTLAWPPLWLARRLPMCAGTGGRLHHGDTCGHMHGCHTRAGLGRMAWGAGRRQRGSKRRAEPSPLRPQGRLSGHRRTEGHRPGTRASQPASPRRSGSAGPASSAVQPSRSSAWPPGCCHLGCPSRPPPLQAGTGVCPGWISDSTPPPPPHEQGHEIMISGISPNNWPGPAGWF